MTISEALLPEFDQEMAYSRKTLERVPDDRLGWKPHEKSMTMGRLASHLSEAPGWTLPTLEKDALDMAPPGTPPYQPVILSSRKEMLEKFDKEVVSARAAIAAASDQHLFKPWSLLMGGEILLTQPRITILRTWVMNHSIHHRAQLGVYLRLNDIPVPAIYGPSADEQGM